MNDNEQKNVELMRMFDAYGQTPTPSRLEMYLEALAPCSPSQLQEAIRDAIRDSADYPPGPGTLARCLRAIARNRPGDPIGDWRYPGTRHGAIDAPRAAEALMEGIARRTQSMSEVFRRAREIRAAGLVPPDIWGRFASEVMAELEMEQNAAVLVMNPHAEVSAEMRRCMAHAREWREAKGIA